MLGFTTFCASYSMAVFSAVFDPAEGARPFAT
jgi:hypothetical protein